MMAMRVLLIVAAVAFSIAAAEERDNIATKKERRDYLCTAPCCTTHEHCSRVGDSYCDSTGGCWAPCESCPDFNDAIDGTCPECPVFCDIALGSSSIQPDTDGNFRLLGTFDGRPVYQNPVDSRFIFWGPLDDWNLGPTLGSTVVNGFAEENVASPDQITLGGWQMFDGANFVPDPTLASICGDFCDIELVGVTIQANLNGIYPYAGVHRGFPFYGPLDGGFIFHDDILANRWLLGPDITSTIVNAAVETDGSEDRPEFIAVGAVLQVFNGLVFVDDPTAFPQCASIAEVRRKFANDHAPKGALALRAAVPPRGNATQAHKTAKRSLPVHKTVKGSLPTAMEADHTK